MSKKTKEKEIEGKSTAMSDGRQEKSVRTKDPTDNIKDTLNAIRGKFGEDSIMKLGDKPHVDVDSISTGSIGLDCSPRRRRNAARTHHRGLWS